MIAIHFYQDTEAGDRNLLQMIATESQFVRAAADRSSWTARERDGAGEYTAEYTRADAHTVIKRKVKYADGAGVEVAESEARIGLDGEGGIASLDGSFRAHLGAAMKDSSRMTALAEIHLGGVRKGQAPELAGSLARANAGSLARANASVVRTGI